MVDTRLPDRWLFDPRWVGLSDRALRTLCGLYMYANGHGTDGWVPNRMLYFAHPDGVDAYVLAELSSPEYEWIRVEADGVQVLDWEETQTLNEDIVRARQLKAARMRRWRKRSLERLVDADATPQNAETDSTEQAEETNNETRLQTRLETRRVGKDRQGEERPGQDRPSPLRNPVKNPPPTTEWPTREPGSPPEYPAPPGGNP